MRIVVTGSNGFIGKNLVTHLRAAHQYESVEIVRGEDDSSLERKLIGADVVCHLAAVNRPNDPAEFETQNISFTNRILDILGRKRDGYKLIFTSSTQAVLENDYGKSKLQAEELIRRKAENAHSFIFRLPGVFGKWCRPNYNSVVATFCHNIARDMPVVISDPSRVLELVYIDDVISSFFRCIDRTATQAGEVSVESVNPFYNITLADLEKTIKQFSQMRTSLFIPDVGDEFLKKLYSTWLSYLPEQSFNYSLTLKTDNRGTLFELFKSRTSGQIFLSTTHPGITRGNHFHHTKVEKFVVIKGKGEISFRNVLGDHVTRYVVEGSKPEVVDIPPGYTHSITNVGDEEMITLFWANEIFDAQKTDTQFLEV
jgi:UDP-2-acetamido-2,6-beta-L-arabino-hexul-4-ose reductase